MEREQFTFYKSFWEAAKVLPKKDRLPFLEAVCSYAFGEESKPPTGAALASFLLVKPVLDTANKKAASGKRGGSKPKANGKQTESKTEASHKQTGSDKEGEKEGEKEKEVEGDTPLYPPDVAAVMSAYLNKINPSASQASVDELRGYVEVMGPDVCLRAIDIALDAKAANWYYIRAILRDKQSRGVRCLADWDALEERKERNGGESPASKSGGGNVFAEIARKEGLL